ncbi:12213_t:CDS:1, partial [Racocetra fulgida]
NTISSFAKDFANTIIINLQNTALYNTKCIFDFKQVLTTMQQISTFSEIKIKYLTKYYGEDQNEN